MQAVQAATPPIDRVPGGHNTGSAALSIQAYPFGQDAHSVDPVVEEYVPSAHSRHVLKVEPPDVLEYVPAGHGVLAVPAVQ